MRKYGVFTYITSTLSDMVAKATWKRHTIFGAATNAALSRCSCLPLHSLIYIFIFYSLCMADGQQHPKIAEQKNSSGVVSFDIWLIWSVRVLGAALIWLCIQAAWYRIIMWRWSYQNKYIHGLATQHTIKYYILNTIIILHIHIWLCVTSSWMAMIEQWISGFVSFVWLRFCHSDCVRSI